MREDLDPSEGRACTRVYVLAPWIISTISTPVTIIALITRSGDSTFFLRSYGLLVLAIGVPAGIVSARVAYVAAIHAGGCNGRRIAARYFLCAFLLVAAAMAVMLPVLG